MTNGLKKLTNYGIINKIEWKSGFANTLTETWDGCKRDKKMRDTLKDLFSKTILFKYHLPTEDIKRTDLSTQQDQCFSVSSNKNLSDLIYNGIVDYAIGEKHVNIEKLDLCQRKAIKARLKYDENATDDVKLKYGFFGEVVLDLILQFQFSSNVLLAKGYFYNPLENAEPKGYDAYQFYYSQENGLSLLIGEVKFHASYTTAVVDVLKKLEKSTSVSYFNKNILALITEKGNFEACPTEISSIIDKWEGNPEVNFYDEVKKNSINLYYPILLLYDQTKENYDETIKNTIVCIDSKLSELSINPELDIEFLFLLIPINSSKIVKEDVIKWISQNKPLM